MIAEGKRKQSSLAPSTLWENKKGGIAQYCSLLIENGKLLWHGPLSKSVRKGVGRSDS